MYGFHAHLNKKKTILAGMGHKNGQFHVKVQVLIHMFSLFLGDADLRNADVPQESEAY